MGETSTALHEYSRNIAAHTLKQLIEWQASLEHLSKECERAREQDSADKHGHKGNRSILPVSVWELNYIPEHARLPQKTALSG